LYSSNELGERPPRNAIKFSAARRYTVERGVWGCVEVIGCLRKRRQKVLSDSRHEMPAIEFLYGHEYTDGTGLGCSQNAEKPTFLLTTPIEKLWR